MKKYVFLIMMSVSFWGTAQNWTELTPNPDQAGLENNPLKGFVDLYNDENNFPTSMDAKIFGLDEVMFGLGNDPNDFDWTVMDEWVEENKEEGKYSYIQVNIDPAKGESWMPTAIESLIPYYFYEHPSNPDLNDSCPDWNHPILMNGMLKFIEAFGAQYDNKPEIYMVHLGLYGIYGEWHLGDVELPEHKPEYAMTEENKTAIIEAYEAAFPNTKLLARYPEHIPDPEIVGYSDGLIFTQSISTNSFFDHAFFHNTLKLYGADQNWRHVPIGGEIDPGVQSLIWNQFPNVSEYEADPINNPGVMTPIQNVDAVIDSTHFTFMFTHHIFLNDFIEGSAPWNNAIRAQKRMGYRLEVDSFYLSASNGFPAFQVNISNEGVAPFYANWDVEFAVMNTLTGMIDTLGIADWNLNIIQPDNPGNYRSFISNESIDDGTYKFMFRVVNPLKTASNNAAPLRFANTSQDADTEGWLTLGVAEIVSGNLNTSPIQLSSLSISQTTANLTVGDNLSLGAITFPSTASNDDITWISDHPSRASVNQNGFITAGPRYGNAKVYAYSQNGNLVGICNISVEPDYTLIPSQIEAEDFINLSGPVSDGNKLGFIDAGDWMEYGIELSTSANLEVEIRYSRQPAGDAKIAILNEIGDTLNIVNLPSTTEWWMWDTSTSDPFTLATGNQILKFAALTNGFDLDWINFNITSIINPNECIASNFDTAPIGLTVDQSNGTTTQLLWNHYSNGADGCILNGGTIGTLDTEAAFTQNPGNVLVQGPQIDGLPNGLDNSAQLGPNASFNLFNASTFPAGGTGQMVPDAFYKWKVRCGCIIDASLPLPDRLQAANVILSPWSEYSIFTNLGTSQQGLEPGTSNRSIAFDSYSFNAYPNPFEDRILIEDFDNQIKSYQILDSRGRILFNEIVNENGLIEIDAQTLSPGIYFLNISTSTEMITKKLFKAE